MLPTAPVSGQIPTEIPSDKKFGHNCPSSVSGSAADCVRHRSVHIHAVAFGALAMTASQPAIGFQMTNDRLNRLVPILAFDRLDLVQPR